MKHFIRDIQTFRIWKHKEFSENIEGMTKLELAKNDHIRHVSPIPDILVLVGDTYRYVY